MVNISKLVTTAKNNPNFCRVVDIAEVDKNFLLKSVREIVSQAKKEPLKIPNHETLRAYYLNGPMLNRINPRIKP